MCFMFILADKNTFPSSLHIVQSHLEEVKIFFLSAGHSE